MSHRDHHHDDIEAARPIREEIEKVREHTGREFWRSLEELSDTTRFRDFLHREFPALNAPETDAEMLDPVGRRSFLKLMSASFALAGLTACTRQPRQDIVPYVKTPDGLVPGKPQFYATAMPFCGVANGLLVESHEGRPTKVEGNPDHPSSQGATDIYGQASILQLYDPDRSQSVLQLGNTRSWGEFLAEFSKLTDAQRQKQGAGLRILSESFTSPTLAAQMKQVMTAFPQAKWHFYEPTGRDGARVGAQMAFGEMANVIYKFDAADVVLSLDANFLTNGPGALRYARDFINRRRLINGASEMNRLYVVESTPTTTGAKSDHRLPLRASEVDGFARGIAAAVGIGGISNGLSGPVATFAASVAKDLNAHKGRSIVIAGEHQPAAVHAMAYAINGALGNLGSTVIVTNPIEAQPVDQLASISELVGDLNAGKVETLVILSGNPVYNAPLFEGKQTFLSAMEKAATRIHLGMYNDETAAHCHWHIPENHFLESWGDARAFDGTVSIIQPLIEPMYGGRSAYDVLAAMTSGVGKSAYDLVRDYWRTQLGGNFDATWRQALQDGVIPNTQLPARTVAVKADWASAVATPPAAAGKYEIVFRPDPHVHDGRFANNGWLQETPKPINKIAWDNFAIISLRTATDLGLAPKEEPYHATAKMLEVVNEGQSILLPVWIQPGQPDNSVTVFLGYGRERAGNVGNGLGFNTYKIRTAAAPNIATAQVQLNVGNGTYQLASTQEHFNIDASGIEVKAFIPEDTDLTERHILRVGDLEEYKKDPKAIHHGEATPSREMTIYPNWNYDTAKTVDGRDMPLHAWGMTIDMQACIGCNACVVACQSENNIAVVGKTAVTRGRIMQWMRIDTYLRGGVSNPEIYFQPMMCQHCEDAPCEVVCPVNATVHDAEGLNVQVYNRCVGTRYCSNNCPYKVRRFNYLLYGDWETPSLKNMRNPEVTVRSRGVMEKCTFCVQRIMAAKIESQKEDRRIRDGEITTACQSSCPTQAIVFGDIHDRESQVAKLKSEPRNYEVLADLNTRPRASYLAIVRNPNGELSGSIDPHKFTNENAAQAGGKIT